MIVAGDCLEELKELEADSIDFVCTDPPYGYSFMGKDWDKAVPSVEVWQECLRVLKPGGFINVMSAPRSDVLSRMIVNIEDAGFRVDFTPIYWTYASGFPKAGNIGKLVDKRNGRHQPTDDFKQYLKDARSKSELTVKQVDESLGFTNSGMFSQHYTGNNQQTEYPTVKKYKVLKKLLSLDDRYDEIIKREEAEREIIGKGSTGGMRTGEGWKSEKTEVDITAAATDQAKALDGSYAGFQPKPAVEVIIVAMKPLSEKTFVDQALNNGKGISWLDDARIPTGENRSRPASRSPKVMHDGNWKKIAVEGHEAGRFPANLLVSDDVLNDGKITKSTGGMGTQIGKSGIYGKFEEKVRANAGGVGDSGSYSRYFDLDKWATTLPFLIVPKASKSEKNRGLEHMEDKNNAWDGSNGIRMKWCLICIKRFDNCNCITPEYELREVFTPAMKNHHPTVKPLKLMSYLITLFSREGDIVLDPFCGSGTTCLAAKNLGRKYIGIEQEAEYVEIAEARLSDLKLDL